MHLIFEKLVKLTFNNMTINTTGSISYLFVLKEKRLEHSFLLSKCGKYKIK